MATGGASSALCRKGNEERLLGRAGEAVSVSCFLSLFSIYLGGQLFLVLTCVLFRWFFSFFFFANLRLIG